MAVSEWDVRLRVESLDTIEGGLTSEDLRELSKDILHTAIYVIQSRPSRTVIGPFQASLFVPIESASNMICLISQATVSHLTYFTRILIIRRPVPVTASLTTSPNSGSGSECFYSLLTWPLIID